MPAFISMPNYQGPCIDCEFDCTQDEELLGHKSSNEFHVFHSYCFIKQLRSNPSATEWRCPAKNCQFVASRINHLTILEFLKKNGIAPPPIAPFPDMDSPRPSVAKSSEENRLEKVHRNEIILAAASHDVSELRRLLQKKSRTLADPSRGLALIEAAKVDQNGQMIELLLNHGPILDQDFGKAILESVKNQKWNAFVLLVDNLPNSEKVSLTAPLVFIIENHLEDYLRVLLAKTTDSVSMAAAYKKAQKIKATDMIREIERHLK